MIMIIHTDFKNNQANKQEQDNKSKRTQAHPPLHIIFKTPKQRNNMKHDTILSVLY